MKKQTLGNVFLVLLFIISFDISAGNGVERGRVFVRDHIQIDTQIKSYLDKKLTSCFINPSKEYLEIQKVSIEEDEVDQGITDLYYTVNLIHKDFIGHTINEVSVEVEDADYSNWRNYEEKLSLKFIKDKNQLCH